MPLPLIPIILVGGTAASLAIQAATSQKNPTPDIRTVQVQKQQSALPISNGAIFAIVIAVLLLLVIMR